LKTQSSIRRMTRQRRLLLDTLDRKNWHPTADEVYRIVKMKAPRVSLGTVYRNLDILSKEGVITKIEEAGSQRRYDGNPRPHYHVHCLKCGAIADMPDEAARWLNIPKMELPDFKITGHRLIFEGYCAHCQDKEEMDGKGN